MNWRRLLFLLPLLLGLLISIWMNLFSPSNPILYARVDTGTLLLLIGGFLSILVGTGQYFFLWVDQREENLLSGAAQDRRRFLSRLDHELKNPITAVLAGLANLRSASEKQALEKTLTSVEDQVQRMRRLIADLRKLSDLETRPLELDTIDVAALLEDAYESVRTRPEAGNIGISLLVPRAPWPLPVVQGDSDLLLLAVFNLLENALKFCEDGDAIELRAFEDQNSVAIEVADTGPGIADDEIPYVWDELYRARATRSIPGSGLGLALVRAIVQRHNGKVSVRSRKGSGTVFVIHLPV
ncbi:MAG: HAMP domain-containing histidine kinase [Anaerolineales bacterium]|nr:HAMP domain-containing histidine kinase [Anaerolineales bacterium]